MNGLLPDCFPNNQGGDGGILHANPCQIGNSHVLSSDASPRVSFEELA
jgi:hypothetical protein